MALAVAVPSLSTISNREECWRSHAHTRFGCSPSRRPNPVKSLQALVSHPKRMIHRNVAGVTGVHPGHGHGGAGGGSGQGGGGSRHVRCIGACQSPPRPHTHAHRCETDVEVFLVRCGSGSTRPLPAQALVWSRVGRQIEPQA
jgi:hypothetical protein